MKDHPHVTPKKGLNQVNIYQYQGSRLEQYLEQLSVDKLTNPTYRGQQLIRK